MHIQPTSIMEDPTRQTVMVTLMRQTVLWSYNLENMKFGMTSPMMHLNTQ